MKKFPLINNVIFLAISKTMKPISIIMIFSILSSGCVFTPELWKNTDPDEYIRIQYTKITEDELKAKNLIYIKDDERHSYFVEKNSFHKLKDYTYRTLGTPVTIILDTATILVFAVAFAIAVAETEDEG
jgi:hypothetical protein